MTANVSHADEMIAIPVGELKWTRKVIEFVSPLGTSDLDALVVDWDGPDSLHPSEEERLAFAQASRFLKRVLAGKRGIEGPYLRYILILLGLKQADLARALAVSPSTISNLMKGEAVSSQTARQISLLLELEIEQRGFLERLDMVVKSESDADLLDAGENRKRA